MSNENNSPRSHTFTEWRRGFCELVSGKPFYVCPDKADGPYQVGDQVVFEEHCRGHVTGYKATFRIDWTARSTDNRGAYEALLRPGVVILGLTLIAMVNPSAASVTDQPLFGVWPPSQSAPRLPS